MLKFVKNILQIFCSGQRGSADSRTSANRSILPKPIIGLTQAKELDPSILRRKVARNSLSSRIEYFAVWCKLHAQRFGKLIGRHDHQSVFKWAVEFQHDAKGCHILKAFVTIKANFLLVEWI